jgi:hypothetical protein
MYTSEHLNKRRRVPSTDEMDNTTTENTIGVTTATEEDNIPTTMGATTDTPQNIRIQSKNLAQFRILRKLSFSSIRTQSHIDFLDTEPHEDVFLKTPTAGYIY